MPALFDRRGNLMNIEPIDGQNLEHRNRLPQPRKTSSEGLARSGSFEGGRLEVRSAIVSLQMCGEPEHVVMMNRFAIEEIGMTTKPLEAISCLGKMSTFQFELGERQRRLQTRRGKPATGDRSFVVTRSQSTSCDRLLDLPKSFKQIRSILEDSCHPISNGGESIGVIGGHRHQTRAVPGQQFLTTTGGLTDIVLGLVKDPLHEHGGRGRFIDGHDADFLGCQGMQARKAEEDAEDQREPEWRSRSHEFHRMHPTAGMVPRGGMMAARLPTMTAPRPDLSRTLRCLMLGIAATLTGCAFDTPPNVSVQEVTWLARGESDPPFIELGVGVMLENPTDEPIQLETFEYTFRSGNGQRWNGAWSALRTLPPGESVPMQIPAIVEEIPDQDVLKTSWSVSGTISYKAPGRWAQILFDTGFRRPTHDFSGKGEQITPPEAQQATQETP